MGLIKVIDNNVYTSNNNGNKKTFMGTNEDRQTQNERNLDKPLM